MSCGNASNREVMQEEKILPRRQLICNQSWTKKSGMGNKSISRKKRTLLGRGIVFKLTTEVAEIYQNAFDLHAFNGDESNELPLAATYVIGQDGKIVYAFLDAEYRNRAEPEAILSALRQIH